MKLATIEIQNYRSLFGDDDNKNHLRLELADGINTIVGPNNVGKSTIGRASSSNELAVSKKSHTAIGYSTFASRSTTAPTGERWPLIDML